jgi:ribosomal protein L11 methylase PrmA
MWFLVFAILFIVLLAASLSWTHYVGAQWAPTTLKTVKEMLAMAEVGPNDLVYDLGCGDGRIIVTAARRFGARAVGIEIDPLRYLWCQLLITVLGLRGRVKVIYGNFFTKDLSGADVVTCYLLQNTNEKLQEKFTQELDPNTRVVTNAFTFPKLRLIRQNYEDRIFLYHPVQNEAASKK